MDQATRGHVTVPEVANAARGRDAGALVAACRALEIRENPSRSSRRPRSGRCAVDPGPGERACTRPGKRWEFGGAREVVVSFTELNLRRGLPR